jgi:hypothetical protein
MRLLQRVRPTVRPTKNPPQKVVAPLVGLLLRLPGQATLRQLSRSRS